jgi:hypothetical protein
MIRTSRQESADAGTTRAPRCSELVAKATQAIPATQATPGHQRVAGTATTAPDAPTVHRDG